MPRDETLLANHEAGHAVANAFLAIPFDSISIAHPLEYLSFVKKTLGPKYITGFAFNEPDDDEYFAAKERVKRACVAMLAGPMAEKQLALEKEDIGSENDKEIAGRIALLMTGDSVAATEYLNEREGDAQLVIGMFSDQIDSLAAALLNGQTIQKKEHHGDDESRLKV